MLSNIEDLGSIGSYLSLQYRMYERKKENDAPLQRE